jgi:hypothetical protein
MSENEIKDENMGNRRFLSFSIIPAEDIIEPWIKFNLILVKILKKFFCTQNFGDADQLVVVIMTMEEGLFAKYH